MPKRRGRRHEMARSNDPDTPFAYGGDPRIRRDRDIRDAMAELGDVVYFVRIANEVKIGYTSNIHQRRNHFGIRNEDILAVLPGGRDEERRHHELFAADRVHGEYFNPSPQLLAYINDIRGACGVPDASW